LGCNGVSSGQKDGLLFFGSRIRDRDILDGLSNTVLFGERPSSNSSDLGWWYGGVGANDGTLEHTLGVREFATIPATGVNCETHYSTFRKGSYEDECDALHFWSMHSGGAWFAYADCSIRFMAYDVDKPILQAAATRNGSEVLSEN
jgi:hypothetical protein